MKNNILVILGKSGSGKTTIRDALCKKGYERIITCTTRLPRQNETDYIFLSEEAFQDKIKNNEFLEYDYFNHAYYGSLLKDYVGNKVIVVTPNGYYNIKDKVSCTSIYLYASDSFLLERLTTSRKEDKVKAQLRLEEDRKQFQDVQVDYTILIENKSVDEIIREILDKVKE